MLQVCYSGKELSKKFLFSELKSSQKCKGSNLEYGIGDWLKGVLGTGFRGIRIGTGCKNKIRIHHPCSLFLF